MMLLHSIKIINYDAGANGVKNHISWIGFSII
jgi:hypothetical protein